MNITVPAGAAEASPDAAAVGVQTVPVDAGPFSVKLGTVNDAAYATLGKAKAKANRSLFIGVVLSNSPQNEK